MQAANSRDTWMLSWLLTDVFKHYRIQMAVVTGTPLWRVHSDKHIPRLPVATTYFCAMVARPLHFPLQQQRGKQHYTLEKEW